ncbi:hypothetical protein HYU17_04020 [Candidatus Woesearchaeota archaeon]|nr:hypothetical protein [Candidatus Woesearchaeota archaeon]
MRSSFFRLGHKGSFLVRDDEGIGAAPVKVLAPRALVSYIVATATEQRSTSPSLLPLEALLESLVKELEGVSLHPPFYLGNA